MATSSSSMTEWPVVRFDPTAASRRQWDRLHEFRRLRHEERATDEPLPSDDVVEQDSRLDNPNRDRRRWCVESDDRMVGFLGLSAVRPGAPDYESSRHIVEVMLSVVGDYRRRGIGTQLLRTALHELDALEARILSGFVEEPDGHPFAEWCGARATQVERLSRLDFATVDWADMDAWIADLEVRAPGARLELYPDRIPDDFLEEYCSVRTELMNLMPWDDSEHGDIIVTPDTMRTMYERLAISATEHHTYISREPDGTISGMTDVSWTPEHPGHIDQWFTGVHPDYRRRGLGKALKAAMLRYVDERYEGIECVRTGNATTNAAMLAINERMGFRECSCFTVYQLDRDELAAHLAGLS